MGIQRALEVERDVDHVVLTNLGHLKVCIVHATGGMPGHSLFLLRFVPGKAAPSYSKSTVRTGQHSCGEDTHPAQAGSRRDNWPEPCLDSF